jgi:tryptophan-rich sensory protein
MQIRASGHKNLIAFAVFFVTTAFVYVGSGIVTAASVGGWYQALNKPPFNPPDWLFAPVWTALYLMMAIAGWIAWRQSRVGQKREVVVAFSSQLGLNCLWSILFFGLQWVGVALIEIVLLWASILWTTNVFWPIDRRAALLFVPYALWVTFAIALNAAIWMLN